MKKPPSPTSTFPALWNHSARHETLMECEPDSQLVVKPGMEDRAAVARATASRSHINLDFRFTSQPLTVAHTARVSIGGTAWPNVCFSDERFDYSFLRMEQHHLGYLELLVAFEPANGGPRKDYCQWA